MRPAAVPIVQASARHANAANVPLSDVTPPPPSLCRQQGGERRRAAGELLAESGALQQADQAGCQQEPAGGHLHPGVSVSAHQCCTYPSHTRTSLHSHTVSLLFRCHTVIFLQTLVGPPPHFMTAVVFEADLLLSCKTTARGALMVQ